MLLIIGNLFDKLFGKTADAIASSAEAKAKRETVGKAEAAVLAKQQAAQQKALRSMDKVGPDMIKKKGGGEEAAAPPPAAGYRPPAANEAFMPPPGQMPPPMQVGVQPMQSGQHMCPCGQYAIDPSWDVCPYCQVAVAKGVSRAQVGAQMSGGGAAKTVAIDASQLTHSQHTAKAVVGWIVCMVGQQQGQDFRLHDGRNVVGTAADCDIVVFDPYLSARHSVIICDSKDCRYVIQDLDSRNGTYVNRQRVMKQDLIDNDEIRFGQAEFRFKALY
jgi:hypothetical protein